jgi:hypothetical protein
MMKLLYLGLRDADIPNPLKYDPRVGQIWRYIVIILYNPILFLVKSSVLLFLLRLGGHDRNIWWWIHIINAVNICLMIAVFVASVFTCTPISFFWDYTIKDGYCNHQGAQYIGTAVITVVTDILVLILPIKIVSGLTIPRRGKLGLIAILTVGGM